MFKYKVELENISTDLSCIDSSYVESERTAFRWVFEDINHTDNFLPRALIPHPLQEHQKTQCNGWSLSFFQTLVEAENRLREICKDKEKAYKRLGTHIAIGDLEKTDGKSGNVGESGHFEHHEYVGTIFSSKFIINKKIY
jgi:hypothetical protein